MRPFSGSTPAWAARPVIVDRVVGDALARAHDVAVGARALEHERDVVLRAPARGSTGPQNGEPISSSGLQTYVMRPNPSNPASCSTSTAKNPVSKPALHVRDARARARCRPSIENGRSRHGPVVEDGVHVTDQQHRGSAAALRASRSRDRRAAARPARGVRPSVRPTTPRRGTAPRTGPRSRSRLRASTSRSRRSPSARGRPRTRRSARRRGREEA